MRQIEVFDGDTWLCTAYPQDALPESERDAVLARRRADAAELARRQRRASRRPGPRYGYRPMTVAPAVAAAPPATSAAAGPARVTVLSDPGDSPQAVAELAGRHDLDRGVAVCQPHPGATSPELLARDLLVALGKLTGALAAEHLSRRGWELAALWLAAEQVRHLIVLRATAARLLDPAAFAQVDTVYRDTYARARGHNAALRHASGGDCAGAVLQQLTIDAASADEVLTRLRAAQAGLFADGLLLDLRLRRHPPWELRAGCLRPRLDHATVARLRGLADPVVAAAVTLSRATAMTPAQLCALRRRDVTQAGAGLRVRAGRLTYRIPARAAGPVRAAALHQPPAPDGGLASADGQAPLLVTPGGAPISETALKQLRHHGAARAGGCGPTMTTMPCRWGCSNGSARSSICTPPNCFSHPPAPRSGGGPCRRPGRRAMRPSWRLRWPP